MILDVSSLIIENNGKRASGRVVKKRSTFWYMTKNCLLKYFFFINSIHIIFHLICQSSIQVKWIKKNKKNKKKKLDMKRGYLSM